MNKYSSDISEGYLQYSWGKIYSGARKFLFTQSYCMQRYQRVGLAGASSMLCFFSFSCVAKEMQTEKNTDETTVEEGPSAFSGTVDIVHQGLDRSYGLYIPEGIQSDASLVVVMHGYSSSAQAIEDYSGFNELADREGFAVVYPQGTTDDSGYNFFNVGYGFHEDVTVDDVSFVSALVTGLQQEYGFSTDNVFATGMSNGGEMSYVLACDASDLFAAIAPVAGTMMEDKYNSCQPAKALPVFEIHGTSDSVSWYNGDLDDVDGWGAYVGIDSIISLWSGFNELSEVETSEIADIDPADGSTIVFERHYSSDKVNEVWLYKVQEGEHDWPGAYGNMDIESAEEIWQFFSGYVR